MNNMDNKYIVTWDEEMQEACIEAGPLGQAAARHVLKETAVQQIFEADLAKTVTEAREMYEIADDPINGEKYSGFSVNSDCSVSIKSKYGDKWIGIVTYSPTENKSEATGEAASEEKVKALISEMSDEEKGLAYRLLKREYVKQDIFDRAAERDIDLDDADAEIAAEYFETDFDCNQDYWTNIDCATNKALDNFR